MKRNEKNESQGQIWMKKTRVQDVQAYHVLLSEDKTIIKLKQIEKLTNKK